MSTKPKNTILLQDKTKQIRIISTGDFQCTLLKSFPTKILKSSSNKKLKQHQLST